ncbi:MAG: GNAT family N-acetyltransferase [Candidatus Aminicenantes bacterium]|nr:GNAT family N-acetyltransferase [Candidatus Aminicenantes bacterium]
MDNQRKFLVREFKISDLDSIKRISEALHPEWFTEKALENIPRDIQFARCFVVESDRKIVGFISVHSHEGKPMIGWLAVDRKLRGKGIGKLLLEKAERELISFGYTDLRVETVGECTPVYKPYAETLKFYKSKGFEVEKRGGLRDNMGYKWRYSTLRKKLSSG